MFFINKYSFTLIFSFLLVAHELIAADELTSYNDFPKTVHILVLDNPFPEIAKFYFTPSSGEANVSIRIRMRTSSNIVAIAEMADGTVGEAKSYVDVTIGACS